MTIPGFRRPPLTAAVFCILSFSPGLGHTQSPALKAGYPGGACSRNYERITAHLKSVHGPRGYFNLVVGLYSNPLAGWYGAQLDVKPGLMILDVAPGFPRLTAAQIHHIETISGYSPGPVEIQELPARDFAETGPGRRKIQPPKSGNAFVTWTKQNFINQHY